MRKLLLVLQFSPGDRDVAMELTRLILDLEDGVCPYADLMLSASWGTKHNLGLVELAKKKFANVYTHSCFNQITGWPAGPNNQVSEVVSDVFVGHRDRGWDYAAFMLMEPDFVPLARDWIKQIYNEWHHGGSQQILGAWMSQNMFWCQTTHINGNCLIAPEFVKENKFFRTHANGSWDTYQASIMLPKARASKLIWNDYRLDSHHNPLPAGVTLEDYVFSAKRYPNDHPLAGQDIFPVYFHGLKGFKGVDLAKKRLLNAHV